MIIHKMYRLHESEISSPKCVATQTQRGLKVLRMLILKNLTHSFRTFFYVTNQFDFRQNELKIESPVGII